MVAEDAAQDYAADTVLNDAVLLHCRAQPHGGGAGGGRVLDELGAALGFVARQGWCGG